VALQVKTNGNHVQVYFPTSALDIFWWPGLLPNLTRPALERVTQKGGQLKSAYSTKGPHHPIDPASFSLVETIIGSPWPVTFSTSWKALAEIRRPCHPFQCKGLVLCHDFSDPLTRKAVLIAQSYIDFALVLLIYFSCPSDLTPGSRQRLHLSQNVNFLRLKATLGVVKIYPSRSYSRSRSRVFDGKKKQTMSSAPSPPSRLLIHPLDR
jgi:hypothetical protein